MQCKHGAEFKAHTELDPSYIRIDNSMNNRLSSSKIFNETQFELAQRVVSIRDMELK